jgi:hypothetical protein
MATQHGYGQLAGTESLVFTYDTIDTTNSYKGEPTTNLITHVIPNSNWNTNGSGVIITQNYGYDHNGVLRSSKIMDNPNSGNASFAYTSAFSVSAGTYTFSAMVKTSSANASSNSFMVLYNMNPITNLGQTSFAGITPGVWTKVSVTGTLASGTTHIAPHFFSLSGDGTNFIEVVDIQLEQKSHATPFAGPLGTRSSTQGLLDLTGNKTISLSTVSFDSNAQMIFDGTDDTLNIGIPLTDLPALSNFTIDCVVKIDAYPAAAPPNGYGSTTKAGVLVGAAYYSGTALYWYGNSSGTACTIYAYIRGADGYRTAGGFNLTPGSYHHLVLVNDYSGGSIKLYANGVLNGSAATATQEYNPDLVPTAGNIGISKAQVDGGGTQVYSPLPCLVPITKIYRTALSPNDVLQNFKKYQTRFGIA